MFTKIMAPVDLSHADRLDRAMRTAAELARLWDLPVVYVGVTSNLPGRVGHTPQEYERHLADFAQDQGSRHGIRTEALMRISHDPTAELEDHLLAAVKDTGADLVVMGTHVPGIGDRLWPSNGGRIAGHAGVSVMLVRGQDDQTGERKDT